MKKERSLGGNHEHFVRERCCYMLRRVRALVESPFRLIMSYVELMTIMYQTVKNCLNFKALNLDGLNYGIIFIIVMWHAMYLGLAISWLIPESSIYVRKGARSNVVTQMLALQWCLCRVSLALLMVCWYLYRHHEHETNRMRQLGALRRMNRVVEQNGEDAHVHRRDVRKNRFAHVMRHDRFLLALSTRGKQQKRNDDYRGRKSRVLTR